MVHNHTLVFSSSDPASLNMFSYLLKNRGFVSLSKNTWHTKLFDNVVIYLTYENLLNVSNLEFLFPHSDTFIFLSKHASESRKPALTAHFVGNFGEDTFGGNPYELGIAIPSLLKTYLVNLNKQKNDLLYYDILMESTHHGPTSINKPVIFIEIGSSDIQWNDTFAASIVCDTLLTSLSEYETFRYKKIGIGLGGNHYASKFNKLLLTENEICFGLVASKYNLRFLDENMLEQMIVKSSEKITNIFIDSKGLGEEKQRILNLVSKQGLDVVFL